MFGDRTVASRAEPAPWPIRQRINSIVWGSWQSQQAPTGTHQRAYAIAAKQFETALTDLKRIDLYLDGIETELEQAGGPWTPGRMPTWTPPATP